ncbi:MAG TPA: helix-turn-helix transcriptional regulator [Pedobacter sp.]
MKKNSAPYIIGSISEFHRMMGLAKPEHPLVSVIRFEDILRVPDDMPDNIVFNFYSVWLKKNYTGKMKYGQQYYDFDEGSMSFFSPGQVFYSTDHEQLTHTGWWLIIHPDFLWNYPLARVIRDYGYFSYAVNEALHLSEKEELMVGGIMMGIEHEYKSVIDKFSQNVIVSQIELLLNYADRFYNRQFITRKVANHDMLDRLERLLSAYLSGGQARLSGLPSVQFLSEQLYVSPNYLSDLLKNITGKTTQQHIHDKIIEKAKEKLSSTALSVTEIAYELGFEHSQSFSKLFKGKTNLSPLEFRSTFNS